MLHNNTMHVIMNNNDWIIVIHVFSKLNNSNTCSQYNRLVVTDYRLFICMLCKAQMVGLLTYSRVKVRDRDTPIIELNLY